MLRLGLMVLLSFSADANADNSFDWRTHGGPAVISPVKAVTSGSALSVAITEAVESIYAIKTNSSVKVLSTAETEDCCPHLNYPNVFQCIDETGGLCTESDYPQSQGKCGNTTCKAVASAKGTRFFFFDEEQMKTAIHKSPLVASVDASRDSFQQYTGGVYSDKKCSTTNLDHVVQVVGYGIDEGKQFWTIRNSWGAQWGEQGYMRIERGSNMCGIASNVFYPLNIKQV